MGQITPAPGKKHLQKAKSTEYRSAISVECIQHKKRITGIIPLPANAAENT